MLKKICFLCKINLTLVERPDKKNIELLNLTQKVNLFFKALTWKISSCVIFLLNAFRRGSGSACRSVYGGFVHWKMGSREDGEDSRAIQLHPASHWPDLRVLICVASDSRKKTSSSVGMKNSVETSPLLKYR
jgi:hypothetical protein